MKLADRIEQDLNEALKTNDAAKVSVLRMIKSALHNQQIALGHELSDEEVIKVLSKEAKQRQESVTSFTKGGRDEMAAKETKELEIIETYLPEKLSEDELNSIVEAAITNSGASGPADMGKAMGEANKLAAGKADGAQLAALVKAKLLG